MTLDAMAGGDCCLVSYDVSGRARSAATRVCQIVFGRRRTAKGREREDPGFIHRPGVVWIGQSVLVMPFRDANELAERLLRLGVRVAMAPMAIPRESLEAFRWPRAQHVNQPGLNGDRVCRDSDPSEWLRRVR